MHVFRFIRLRSNDWWYCTSNLLILCFVFNVVSHEFNACAANCEWLIVNSRRSNRHSQVKFRSMSKSFINLLGDVVQFHKYDERSSEISRLHRLLLEVNVVQLHPMIHPDAERMKQLHCIGTYYHTNQKGAQVGSWCGIKRRSLLKPQVFGENLGRGNLSSFGRMQQFAVRAAGLWCCWWLRLNWWWWVRAWPTVHVPCCIFSCVWGLMKCWRLTWWLRL